MNIDQPRLRAVSLSDERIFPVLPATQLERIVALGERRPVTRGEVLVDVGQQAVPFFVVVSGEIQVLLPVEAGDE